MELNTYKPYDIIINRDNNVECNNHPVGDDNNQPSYSKYGGYNGYDDDTIDSAFEGMPEATWNID